MSDSYTGIKSYVLRQGRYSFAQKRSYEKLASLYCLENGSGTGFPLSENKPLVIEIGFGMGTSTSILAEQNPEKNYLGIEVHKPGIGKLLWEIEKRGLNNLRIYEGDAALILKEEIPQDCVSGFHVFFPDPWPKKRHNKRRLMTRPFTDLLASRLAAGGYIHMVTDSEDYAGWALEELTLTNGISNPYGNGFAPPHNNRPVTKFEKKAFDAGRTIREIYFKRL